jgi:hypothetical protein
MSTAFIIGNPGGERVQIDVLARSQPNEADYWDGNWVKAEVTVVAGPWHGTFHADLRSEEFDQLREQMQRLYDDKSAPSAAFEAMEPWLRFHVGWSDRLGHIEVKGEARREPFFEGHNVLQFILEIDQSFLPSAIRGLDEVLAQYPVIGSPTDSGRKGRTRLQT